MFLIIAHPHNVERKDRKLVLFISGYFIIQAINIYVKLIIGNFTAWEYLSKGILALLLINGVISLPWYSILKAIKLEVCFSALFLFTYLMGTYDSSTFTSITFNALAVYLPLGICAYNINDKEKLIKALYFSSWIIQGVILLVMFGFTKSYGAVYLTSGSYILSMQMCVVLDHYFSERRIRDIIISLVDLFIIIAAGSRGPLVCISSYLILRAVFSNGLSKKKKILLILALIGISAVLLVNYYSFATYLMTVSSRIGFSSRSLRLLLTNELTADSGRGSLAEYYIGLVKQKPILGYGIAGGWSPERGYPHNIFVEFFLSFGVLFGALASVFYIWVVFRGVINKNAVIQRLTHIFIADTICLLFSGSFVMWASFFMCIALCISKGSARTIAHIDEME